jgi:hypothetical protein
MRVSNHKPPNTARLLEVSSFLIAQSAERKRENSTSIAGLPLIL